MNHDEIITFSCLQQVMGTQFYTMIQVTKGPYFWQSLYKLDTPWLINTTYIVLLVYSKDHRQALALVTKGYRSSSFPSFMVYFQRCEVCPHTHTHNLTRQRPKVHWKADQSGSHLSLLLSILSSSPVESNVQSEGEWEERQKEGEEREAGRQAGLERRQRSCTA